MTTASDVLISCNRPSFFSLQSSSILHQSQSINTQILSWHCATLSIFFRIKFKHQRMAFKGLVTCPISLTLFPAFPRPDTHTLSLQQHIFWTYAALPCLRVSWYMLFPLPRSSSWVSVPVDPLKSSFKDRFRDDFCEIFPDSHSQS